MANKKSSKKESEKSKKNTKKSTKRKNNKSSKKESKTQEKKPQTLELKTEKEIAQDFAVKTYQKFNKIIKSVILFGSQAKGNTKTGSDIDIIIVVDDATINWDQELIAWYREELNKIINLNPYKKDLHINTIKLTTWWDDLMKGDPTVMNIVRYGEPLIDFAGFFDPIKRLLLNGKIKPSPEAIKSCIERAPMHIARSKSAKLGSIEGLFWSMVDSAHAAILTYNVLPPSPEHLPEYMNKYLVNKNYLKKKYVDWYKNLQELHKKISRGNVKYIKGVEIDDLQEKAQEFMNTMYEIVNKRLKEQGKI